MRFRDDGPSIPDDLLQARDEGRVVFFCGSGVSRARAGLSDFFGLAELVLDKLRTPTDHSARRVLAEARSVEERTGVPGLISADRIFASLEREFPVRDVEEAVAQALCPPDGADISAHRILIDLATTREGNLRLVTTNFDHLFEQCCPGAHIWNGPRLPNPSRPDEMNGLVYLHGRVNDTYTGPEKEGLILSSPQFGEAYLAAGWATRFIREIIDRYVVVFVGYSADDPPIHYLLEALNLTGRRPFGTFAFQEGESEEATSRWIHKGVEAIPYGKSAGHSRLWESLDDWSKRATNPEEWYKSVIQTAAKGPQNLQPHERGWIAHVVSTVEGARVFCEAKPPPPADWLCCFDPQQRYATPVRSWQIDDDTAALDPFPLYSLDSDPVPEKADLNQTIRDRQMPPDVWSAFRLTKAELLDVSEDNCPRLSGLGASSAALLPPRLQKLATWIASNADEPTTLWWAARKGGLHPNLERMIAWQTERTEKKGVSADEIRSGWSYLLKAWKEPADGDQRDWYDLQRRIGQTGWNAAVAREFGELFRPALSVRPAWRTPIPPSEKEVRLRDIVDLDVKYLDVPEKTPVPLKFLPQIVAQLREALELAVRLEREIGGYGLYNLSPIVADEDHAGEVAYERSHGLSGLMLFFSNLFGQLKSEAFQRAKREFFAWPQDDDSVFMRLRIWASADRKLFTDREFGAFIGTMSDGVFWDSYHQRDLLLAISSRWEKLGAHAKRKIENRLLRDSRKFDWIPRSEIRPRKAWIALSRIGWLQQNGCKFGSKFVDRVTELQTRAPDWKPSDSSKAAVTVEARGGTVRTDTTFDFLVNLPLKDVLPVAKEAQGRTEDFLVEADPFRGLATARPVRAWSALVSSHDRGEFAEWAWRAFLNTDIRKEDSERMIFAIAGRLARFDPAELAVISRPATLWLGTKATQLATKNVDVFERLVNNLITAIQVAPEHAASGVHVTGDRDWVFEAINSPAGRLAESLMDDPRKDGRKAREGFPQEWLNLVETVIQLPDDHRRYSLVILCSNLNWFFAIAPEWTQQHLIQFAASEDPLDRDAFWSGFLRGARVPYQELYLILKPYLIRFAKEGVFARRGYGDVLAGVLLAGWGSKLRGKRDRIVTDDEMRDLLVSADETFRGKVLRQLRIWISGDDSSTRRRWVKSSQELFRGVWPKQKFVRTSAATSSLVDLIFVSKYVFERLVDAVLPLLTSIEQASFTTMPSLRMDVRREGSIITKCSAKALAVMHAILPDDPRNWPYEADKVLEGIGDANEQLKNDARYLELMRRWNAR